MVRRSISSSRSRPWRAALVGSLLVLLVPAALAAPASARPAAISGKLSKPGYTLVALGYGGKATIARPGTATFKIVPPEGKVTLQLINARGKYAGAVVVAGARSRVVEGVKAGAHLGRIAILNGYAKVGKPVPSRWIDARRFAQARKGVPLGNGRNFGLVRSRVHSGPVGPGGDNARTGVPNEMSVDADGDGIIDALTPSRRVHAPNAHAASAGTSSFGIFSQFLPGFLEDSVNADASAVSTAQIDIAMSSWLWLVMQVLPVTSPISTAAR